MKRKLINIAYCIYPDYKSSEGIVNYNWLCILLKSSNQIVEISQKRVINHFKSVNEVFKIENTLYSGLKKESLLKYLIYKSLNVFISFLSGETSLHEYLWVQKTSKILEREYTKDAVIWSRVLPVNSLKSILKFYEKEKFPFIININDPLIPWNVENNTELTLDERLLLSTKDKAQAWTFPSSKLANNVAEKYSLDKSRCFVIPHALTPFKDKYKRKNEKIKILYTGTFYKSAFTDEFKDTLEAIQKLEVYNKLEFTFVLSQYNDESISWLKSTLPDVKLMFKLDRGKVLEMLKGSDLMLVIDAETHTDLLKGKLVEAISYGIPVFTPTFQDSIMDKVTTEYGCNSSYQDVKGDSFAKLIDAINKLDNKEWLNSFYIDRESVIQKFSEDVILKKTYEVTEFAYQRFSKNENFTIKEFYNWP